VIIEADSRRYHGTAFACEADSRKDGMLQAAGYRLIRLTWDQVTRDGAQTVARLRRALASS
jgi:very-short-patch-repair endonuclease